MGCPVRGSHTHFWFKYSRLPPSPHSLLIPCLEVYRSQHTVIFFNLYVASTDGDQSTDADQSTDDGALGAGAESCPLCSSVLPYVNMAIGLVVLVAVVVLVLLVALCRCNKYPVHSIQPARASSSGEKLSTIP